MVKACCYMEDFLESLAFIVVGLNEIPLTGLQRDKLMNHLGS